MSKITIVVEPAVGRPGYFAAALDGTPVLRRWKAPPGVMQAAPVRLFHLEAPGPRPGNLNAPPAPHAVLFEQRRTRDRIMHCTDGGWATQRIRPEGDGWEILRDGERSTVWVRPAAATSPEKWGGK